VQDAFKRIAAYEEHYRDDAGMAERKSLEEFNKVLQDFPPVLHEYYLQKFPDPVDWYKARAAFVKTNAMFSMVGHVLGVGDRHGENILIDENTGGVVHVDFNCIFEKGKTLKRPELVPFRLTQCIVDVFGPSGVEGTFKKTCELTMSILRANQETLKTVLSTFVHDPLVEWDDKTGGPQKYVRDIMSIIDTKVNGIPIQGLPMSVEGQVADLIAIATDKSRLSKMYIGWMPYL
jgi:serine/threonine-protein kinase ATR